MYGRRLVLHRPQPRAGRLVRFTRRRWRLEALSVDDARARLVVLLLRAPEVLEGRERRENRTTDPDRVLALGGRDDLDLFTFVAKSTLVRVMDRIRG